MPSEAHIRIKPSTGEIDIEGNEQFVNKMLDRFTLLIGDKAETPSKLTKSTPAQKKRGGGPGDLKVPGTFGEFLHLFSELTDQDKVLVAAYFIQSNDPDDVFKTRAVNKLLKDHRIKIANAALAVKRHSTAKRVFTVRAGVYRVSKPGISYLKELLAED